MPPASPMPEARPPPIFDHTDDPCRLLGGTIKTSKDAVGTTVEFLGVETDTLKTEARFSQAKEASRSSGRTKTGDLARTPKNHRGSQLRDAHYPHGTGSLPQFI